MAKGKSPKGYSWHAKAGKWQASITVSWRRINLGLHASEQEAAEAVRIARLDPLNAGLVPDPRKSFSIVTEEQS